MSFKCNFVTLTKVILLALHDIINGIKCNVMQNYSAKVTKANLMQEPDAQLYLNCIFT